MDSSLLLNSSNKMLVLTQAKFGSSSATATRIVQTATWSTGTGYYTYPVIVPGGSGGVSSKVYSSTEDSAICYEQLFTQSPDPRPMTPDWTNFICKFTAGDWSEWQASVYATAYTSTGCEYPKSDTPLVRAFYTASSEDALSAYLPVDGFNFVTDFTGTSIWSSYESSYVSNGSGSGKYSASTTAWHPIAEIAGTETGEMLAAVCVNMAFFNWSSFNSADSYRNWSAGLYSALPPGCAFSGKIQFRRDSDRPSSSAEATAEFTYVYSGTSTATASASSVVYNVPSGGVTANGLAVIGEPTSESLKVTLNKDNWYYRPSAILKVYDGTSLLSSVTLNWSNKSAIIDAPIGSIVTLNCHTVDVLNENSFSSFTLQNTATSGSAYTGWSAGHPIAHKDYFLSGTVYRAADICINITDHRAPFTAEWVASSTLGNRSGTAKPLLKHVNYDLFGTNNSALMVNTSTAQSGIQLKDNYLGKSTGIIVQGGSQNWYGELYLHPGEEVTGFVKHICKTATYGTATVTASATSVASAYYTRPASGSAIVNTNISALGYVKDSKVTLSYAALTDSSWWPSPVTLQYTTYKLSATGEL